MTIAVEKKRAILRCVARLVRKNSSLSEMAEMALKGLFEANFRKQFVSKVFEFNPHSESPIETLVAESLVNGLSNEDIDEIFKRFARNKGLNY